MEFTFEAIRDRIKTAFKNPVNRVEGGFSMDNTQAVSQELSRLYQMEVLPIPDNYSLETAEGAYLDRKGIDFAEPRKDGEKDDLYRKRLLEKVQRPITGGNENQYVYWAKQVEGVGNARCIGCWNGGGTVKVIIISESADIPTTETLQYVTSYIEARRLIGAQVTVVGATPLAVAIAATLEIAVGYKAASVQEGISAAVAAYLNGIAYTDTLNLSYHRIGELMFHVEGVENVVDYTINGNKQSLTATIDEFFKMGEVIVSAAK